MKKGLPESLLAWYRGEKARLIALEESAKSESEIQNYHCEFWKVQVLFWAEIHRLQQDAGSATVLDNAVQWRAAYIERSSGQAGPRFDIRA